MTQDNTDHYKSQALNPVVLTKRSEINTALGRLDKEAVYALDFETTSLFPEDGKVRLTTICGHGEKFIIDHFGDMPFEEIAKWMSERAWAVFNAGFEGRWIDFYSDNIEVTLYDVGNMRKAKLGGAPLSLAIMCDRDLHVKLDKTEQNSGWSNPILTPSQLHYAMLDGVVTWALYCKWNEELTDDQWNGFTVINDSWRGTVEMEETGLILDVKYHETLVVNWNLKRDVAMRYIRKYTPEHVLPNPNSNKQLSDFLKNEIAPEAIRVWPRTGVNSENPSSQLMLDRNTLRHAAHRLPYPMRRWVAAIMIMHYYTKYLGTYGQKLIDKQKRFGKITSRFNIAQAITGRYSSSAENLQNIPHKYSVRRSFTTESKILPTGGDKDPIRLILADYSSIEVRVLAELSGDEQLLHDAIYGDVHSRSAAKIFNINYDDFQAVIDSKGKDQKLESLYKAFKALRTRAKAFTFQLLYGAGASALAIVLNCSDDEAFDAIDGWAKLYPKAFHYRTLMFEKMKFDGFLPVIDGRTIFVHRLDRTMPVAANYPVQGAAASVMYRAVYHCHRTLWTSGIACRLAASVHDEILLYARNSCAEQSKVILVGSMTQGWLDIFPNTNTDNLLEAVVGDYWSDK